MRKLVWLASLATIGTGAATHANAQSLALSVDSEASTREATLLETEDFERAGAYAHAEPLSIEQAVELGRSRSFRIARSLRNQEAADLRERSARSAYYPRADLNINTSQAGRAYSYSNDLYRFDRPPYADFQGGASVYASVPLDVSGVIGRQVEHAELQQTMAGNDVLQAVIDTSLEIRLAYVEALRAQRAVEIDERIAMGLERLIARAPSSITPFLQVELANARQTLNGSRTNADLAVASLRQILRVGADAPLALTSRLDDRRPVFDRAGLLHAALANRPDVRQSQLRLEQARLSLAQVGDSRRPTVNLSAYYNAALYGEYFFEPDDGRSESGGVTIGLNIPLAQWDNGNLRRQRQQAALQVEQAEADSVELGERVAQELRQVQISLDRAEQRLRDLPDEQSAYQAMQRAERDLLAAAPGRAFAVLAQASNARSVWRSAQLAAIDAQTDYYSAAFRLMRTMGLEPETVRYAKMSEIPAPVAAGERFASLPGPGLAVAEDPPTRPEPAARSNATEELGLNYGKSIVEGPHRAGTQDDLIVLRPVRLSDAPNIDIVRATTARSDMLPESSLPRSSRGAQRQPGIWRQIIGFVFGERRRTVVWE